MGAIVLDRVEREKFGKAELLAWLDEGLARAEDRALFDLPVGGGNGHAVDADASLAETRSVNGGAGDAARDERADR